MKNSAIEKLITSNFETVLGHNEILDQINVESMWSQGDERCFHVDVCSHPKYEEHKDIITKLEVRLNSSEIIESDYCVSSENVREMLENQFNGRSNDYVLDQKIIRTAPCKFTYWVSLYDQVEEIEIDIQIKQLKREVF